jgi:predicted trehalose synthase
MKRLATPCVLFLVLAGVGGCSGNSADSLMKQQIALTNQMADILEDEATDEATAEATMAKLKPRQEELKKKMDALPEEEKKKVMEQNKEAFKKANERFINAFFKKVEEKELLEKKKAK